MVRLKPENQDVKKFIGIYNDVGNHIEEQYKYYCWAKGECFYIKLINPPKVGDKFIYMGKQFTIKKIEGMELKVSGNGNH